MLGVISVILTIVGAACGVANNLIDKKQQDEKITQKVAEAIQKIKD